MTPPLIALEEHYYSPAIWNSFDNVMKRGIEAWPGALEKLFDVGDLRLTAMKSRNVAFQVISHCAAYRPSEEACQAGNDDLAGKIQKSEVNKKHFAGFAVLPTTNPAASAAELERSIKQLGFLGALIDNKAGSNFYDDASYDCFWQKAQDLDVPIYLHPSWPSEELFKESYTGNFDFRAVQTIGGAMWGWHSEVGLHVVRLHAAGVFDRFPKLKIILGHFGEMMPFMLHRIQDQEVIMGKRQRSFSVVWKENIWITTSGVWSIDPMRCILSNTSIDRIMYSVDYPFSTYEQGLKWFQEFEKSGLVSEEQLEMVAYKNAERLLGIQAVR